METNAVRIGEKWLTFLQDGPECSLAVRRKLALTGGSLRVHSVFSKVVNFSAGKELLSVASIDAGGASSFLSLPGENVDLGLAVGDKCVLRAGRLILGENTINFSNAPVWKGPISKGYRRLIIEENITAFKAVLDRKAAPQSAWRYINSGLTSRFDGLRAIQKLKENPAEARNLIGLGQGLTPAGDDMLVGFLAIVNHTGENREFVRILNGVITGLLPKTTEISAQVLANALDCDYHELVQNCIRDLCEGKKEEVYVSAASLLNIGATSGSDIACGMYYGMIDK